jgi:hypothetical protein
MATVDLEDTAVEHGFRVRGQGLGEYRKKKPTTSLVPKDIPSLVGPQGRW